jgi:hypothetical protein
MAPPEGATEEESSQTYYVIKVIKIERLLIFIYIVLIRLLKKKKNYNVKVMNSMQKIVKLNKNY